MGGSGGGGQHGPEASTLLCPSACPGGSYKALAANAPCSPCPARSHAPDPAAPVCPCLKGFYRATSDPPEAACTGESPTHPRGGNGMGVGPEVGEEPKGNRCSRFAFALTSLSCALAFPSPRCSFPTPPSPGPPPSSPIPPEPLLPLSSPLAPPSFPDHLRPTPHRPALPRSSVGSPGAVVRGAGLSAHAALAPASGAGGPRGPALQCRVQGVRSRRQGPLSPLQG